MLGLGELCFLGLDGVATSFPFYLLRRRQSVLTTNLFDFVDKLLWKRAGRTVDNIYWGVNM